MADTVNNRVKRVRNIVINGVDAGGAMSMQMMIGYDQRLQSAPDGLGLPTRDRQVQYCRGVLMTHDWTHIIDLLTGTVGTYVCYQAESGAATFTKHTITAPVIHRAGITISSGQGAQYAVCRAEFECRAANTTAGFADMWVPLAAQTEPSHLSSARGGHRIVSLVHGTDPDDLTIYHTTGLTFQIALPLVRACNDGDVGYTTVDAETDGMSATGSVAMQDASVAGSQLLIQRLLLASRGNLVATVRQSQGAANKVITIANVEFDEGTESTEVTSPFAGFSLPFTVANVAGTPLTLAGANKILAVA